MAKILVVEDDPALLRLIGLHLESGAHEALLAANGVQGQRLALTEQPDLVVSDYRMPQGGGLAMLEALAADPATAAIPVIFLTGAIGPDEMGILQARGAAQVLLKPFERATLLNAVAAHVQAAQVKAAQVRAAQVKAAQVQLQPDISIDAPIRIAGYRLLRKLGEGAVAQAYLAARAGVEEPQVLKLMRLNGAMQADGAADGHDSEDSETLQRFIEEFALLSQISHPNVARIYQQGFEGDYAFITMEYFSGGDLRQMMRAALDPGFAVAVLIQISGGLGAVHAAGIVHRDVKPDNIMIRSDGSLAIADFGIAKQLGVRSGVTQMDQIVGTPFYLSPEQATGGAVDQRADIYSLGVMFYEMLTGMRAYDAVTVLGMLEQHVNAPVPRLPDELGRFQPLLEAMMCKNAGQRLPSAAAIVDKILVLGLA